MKMPSEEIVAVLDGVIRRFVSPVDNKCIALSRDEGEFTIYKYSKNLYPHEIDELRGGWYYVAKYVKTYNGLVRRVKLDAIDG